MALKRHATDLDKMHIIHREYGVTREEWGMSMDEWVQSLDEKRLEIAYIHALWVLSPDDKKKRRTR